MQAAGSLESPAPAGGAALDRDLPGRLRRPLRTRGRAPARRGVARRSRSAARARARESSAPSGPVLSRRRQPICRRSAGVAGSFRSSTTSPAIAGEFGIAPADATWAVRVALTEQRDGAAARIAVSAARTRSDHDAHRRRRSHVLHGRGLEPIRYGPGGVPFETIAVKEADVSLLAGDPRRFSPISAPLERDPAARGPLDVILSYPGFHAITAHRSSTG